MNKQPTKQHKYCKKKKKKSYAGLVEQLQEGHGPICDPSPRM
jgi:hypothetical protein